MFESSNKQKGPVPDHRKREVWAIIKQTAGRKDKWVRCGIGFVNEPSQTITVYMDAVPVGDAKLLIRKWETREEREQRLAKYGKRPDFGGAPDGLDGPGPDERDDSDVPFGGGLAAYGGLDSRG